MKIVNDIPRLKPRAIDSHKGSFGKICIIEGSRHGYIVGRIDRLKLLLDIWQFPHFLCEGC